MENDCDYTEDGEREERAKVIKEAVDSDRERAAKNNSEIRGILLRNLIWIVTVIAGVGTVLATVAYQGKDLDTQKAMIAADHERIAKCEQSEIRLTDADNLVVVRLENIENGIKDLKETVDKLDLKMTDRMNRMTDKTQSQFDELKKILYKPVVGNTVESVSSNAIASK